MRAVLLDGYGPADAMHVAEVPDLAPPPGWVRIRVHAAAVNPADFKWRSGMLHDVVPLQFPAVLGYDIAGVVDALGEGALPELLGQRVVGMLDHLLKGGYAEQALLPAEQAVPIPDDLDFAVAAALPTAGLTGVQMVEEAVRPTAGEAVLVTGALGGVGRFALHAGLAAGAKVVAAVRAGQEEAARGLGAGEAFALGMPWQGLPFDHLLDTVGGAAVAALCRQVRSCGRISTVSTTPIPADGLPVAPVFLAVHRDPARLAALVAEVSGGTLAVPVASRLPLAEAAEAHRQVEAGGTGGKVVLLP